jgi:hypothetical protein
MSFQDVGRTKRQPNKGGFGSAPSSGNRVISTASAAAGNNGGDTSTTASYEQLSDLIVQFQVRSHFVIVFVCLLTGEAVVYER